MAAHIATLAAVESAADGTAILSYEILTLES